MPVNRGQIELYCGCAEGGGIRATVQYDPATGAIRNVGGSALQVVNDCGSGKSAPVVLTPPSGQPLTINVPFGTTTRTAAQLAAIGIVTRDDLAGFSLSSP